MKKLILSVICFISACSNTPSTTEPITTPPPQPTLSGAVYFENEILRDHEIFLCPPEVALAAREQYDKTINTLGDERIESFELATSLAVLAAKKQEDCRSYRTNVEGQYKIDDLPAGNYALISGYDGDSGVAVWITDVSLSTGGEVLDLAGSNAYNTAK
jgi:hypothetical protein